jgi:hypothetical protein
MATWRQKRWQARCVIHRRENTRAVNPPSHSGQEVGDWLARYGDLESRPSFSLVCFNSRTVADPYALARVFCVGHTLIWSALHRQPAHSGPGEPEPRGLRAESGKPRA